MVSINCDESLHELSDQLAWIDCRCVGVWVWGEGGGYS